MGMTEITSAAGDAVKKRRFDEVDAREGICVWLAGAEAVADVENPAASGVPGKGFRAVFCTEGERNLVTRGAVVFNQGRERQVCEDVAVVDEQGFRPWPEEVRDVTDASASVQQGRLVAEMQQPIPVTGVGKCNLETRPGGGAC